MMKQNETLNDLLTAQWQGTKSLNERRNAIEQEITDRINQCFSAEDLCVQSIKSSSYGDDGFMIELRQKHKHQRPSFEWPHLLGTEGNHSPS